MSESEAEREFARDYNVNTEEGHLGGYIRATSSPGPFGLSLVNGDPATWSPKLWRWCREKLGARSVLDVGCGEAHAVRFFRELGCDALGVDGSRQAERDSVAPDFHLLHDFASGPCALGRKFDLVWSCEFVEHVEEQYCENFLKAFACSRRYVMMTHAAPGQLGWGHVNCRPAAYWAAKMLEHGFLFDPALTAHSRRAAERGHYRRGGLLFVRC